MRNRLPVGLFIVAALQFIAPLILPLDTLKAMSPLVWGIILAVFGLLGVSLLRRRAWARVATIFVQGFSIIVRILIAVAHAVQGGELGNPVDVWGLGTAVASIILSGIILYYVDLPDIQLVMQAS